MAQHPNKHIREAIRYAERNGWRFEKASARAHIYGTLYCPLRTRDGHRQTVFSTPREPDRHAERIRNAVDRCRH